MSKFTQLNPYTVRELAHWAWGKKFVNSLIAQNPRETGVSRLASVREGLQDEGLFLKGPFKRFGGWRKAPKSKRKLTDV